MPLPPELLRFQPAESIQIRIGEKSGTRGAPVALDHFVLKVMDGGREIGLHPLSKGKPKELNVRLLFDDPMKNCKLGIGWWDGGKPACYNHLGGDEAMRRNSNGVFVPVVCDRTKCPFWLNAKGDNEKIKRLLIDEQQGYRHAYPHLNITRDSKCTPKAYFYFEMPEYTHIGEVARFYTESLNTINQMLTAMTFLAAQTGGILAGIPLKLKVVMRGNAFGKFSPTVTVTASDSDATKWNDKVLETIERRKLSGINWGAYTKALTSRSLADQMNTDAAFVAEHFVRQDDGEPARLDLPADFAMPQDVDEPLLLRDENVKELCRLLNLGDAERLKLQMRFGEDVEKAIEHLTQLCVQRGIDLTSEDDSLAAAVSSVVAEEESGYASQDAEEEINEDEVEDADFTDLEPPITPPDDAPEDGGDELFGDI